LEPIICLRALFVALFDPLGQLGLLGGAEKWEATEIVEEQPHQVRPPEVGSLRTRLRSAAVSSDVFTSSILFSAVMTSLSLSVIGAHP